ncbi:MAG: DEAD/DEAH box helicase [Verrucomicrobiaceae bacterium]|nr:DEAD/DEAH box helicase [Verrucomicrobiaceae bacterium]
MPTKPSAQLTLHDKLSRLNIIQAKKLLGPAAAALLPKAGREEIDIASQVLFTADQFQIVYPVKQFVVTLSLHPSYRDRLQVVCSHEGEAADYYRAATIALILEEKLALGLSAPPNENTPWELIPEHELENRAIAERIKRAAEEVMKITAADNATPWTDYTVTSATSGKSYRVTLRGMQRGQSFCTCPDFRKNRLGLCKHVIKVQEHAKKKFDAAALKKTPKPERLGVFARYDGDVRLAFEVPARLHDNVQKIIAKWEDKFAQTDAEITALFDTIRRLSQADADFVVYPDAEEIINQAVHRRHLTDLVAEIRKAPAQHPLRKALLHTELLPYQMDGIAFAAAAGRAVLADEMGLGKTIQGVGVAEFMARFAGVRRVLVVCPASLKSQWLAEIRRFCDRSVQIVAGKTAQRTGQYATGAFFTIANYEQVLRDYLDIERASWDLIILDEGQRIKNWEAKTSQIIKTLRSPFALVLTGTPLENRLDDLYSVVEFIDDRRLGPAYRFVHGHRIVDDHGKVLGYKNLDALRERLRPILLRRTRQSIQLDLPPRSTEIVRIPATDEQKSLHDSHMQIVAQITSKAFITEMDLLRLQKALLMARMSADSTQLVDKQPPGFSSKLDRLAELLEQLIAEPQRKIILFSEWTSMLNLIEPILKKLKASFVRLDGQVPQKQRQQLVHRFQTDAQCRCFLTTNAGSTGLNLQAADTVINVDLPWNPALLEQRIARAHRMGQKRKVQVYLLITETTIEENLLATLSAKHELAAAVLDPDSDLREVQLQSGMDQLKRRLEVLLGAKPEADRDVTQEQIVQQQITTLQAEQKAKIAEASGTLLTSAFSLLTQALPNASAPDEAVVTALKTSLSQCLEPAENGQTRLSITLPGQEALETMARALATLMAAAK